MKIIDIFSKKNSSAPNIMVRSEKKTKAKRLKGFTLLEMIVSLGFLAILLAGASEVFYLSLNIVDRSRQYTTAELLAHDLLELVVSKRNEDWNSINAGEYYFIDDPVEGIVFAAGTETIDEFTRSVFITEVQRNGSGNIVESGGTVDNDTFKAEAVVTWSDRFADREIHLVEYLTNWNRF